MPVKRRIDKRRFAGPPAPAWAVFFETGYDYLWELLPFGLEDDAAVREAAQGAWEAHGEAFMRQWVPMRDRALPWALEAYGKPWEDAADAN